MAADEAASLMAAIRTLMAEADFASDSAIAEVVRAAESKVEAAGALAKKMVVDLKTAKAGAEEAVMAAAKAGDARKASRSCLDKTEDAVKEKKRLSAAAEHAAREETEKGRQKRRDIEDRFLRANLTVMAKKAMPGAVEGDFVSMVPVSARMNAMFELKSKADGTAEVLRLALDGTAESVEFSDFKESVNKSGGFFHDGKSAYCVCPAHGAKNMPIPASDFLPSNLKMGEPLLATISSMAMSTKNFSFAVDILIPGVKNPVRAATVGFNEPVRIKDVDGVLRKFAKAPLYKVKPPPQPTVVLYSGRIIRREMNRTLVPSSPIADRNWSELHREAMNQLDAQRQWQRDKEMWLEKELGKQIQRMRSSCAIRIVVTS